MDALVPALQKSVPSLAGSIPFLGIFAFLPVGGIKRLFPQRGARFDSMLFPRRPLKAFVGPVN